VVTKADLFLDEISLLEGLTIDEIASLFKLTPKSVQTYIYRYGEGNLSIKDGFLKINSLEKPLNIENVNTEDSNFLDKRDESKIIQIIKNNGKIGCERLG
jgi:hypothetical protein